MTGINKNCQDESCVWSALLDSSRLLRRNRQSGRGRGVSLYVIEGLEHMELKVGNGTVENLWVRIKGQTNNVDVTVGVHYRLPNQDNDANELSFEELRDTSKSTL